MGSIEDLKFDPQNARRRTERSSEMIRNSLKKFKPLRSLAGYRDKDGKIVIKAGNGTLKEAIDLGITKYKPVERSSDELVVVIANDLSEEEWTEYATADNRTSELSEWDTSVLIRTHADVDLSEWFTADEIEEWSDPVYPQIAGEEDEKSTSELLDQVEKDAIESRVKPGEIWAIGRHRIACGDSTDEANVRKLLGDRFGNVGMVWADAPYGINVVSKDGSLGGNTKGKYSQILGDETKDVAYASFALCQKLFDALQFFWGANHFASAVTDSSCWIVWDKQDGKSVTFADCELAWTNIKQPARIFKHIWDGFRRDSGRGEMRSHPTQKPIALCEWAFEKYGSPSDLIFDPFLGSAPSIIAAQKMEGDRTVYGFELSPDYCEVICQRFEKFTGQNAELVGHL